MSTLPASSDQDPIYRTQIEKRFAEKRKQAGLGPRIIPEPAWYFSASFANVQNGVPVGYLRRY